MIWTPEEQRAVTQVMLGTWPGTITQWGREAFAAYLLELQARELSAEQIVVAVRSWPAGPDFPPSAPNLAAHARQDPARPTVDEMFAQLYEPGGLFGFKRSGVVVSPYVEKFAVDYGRERLRLEPVNDPGEGKWARRRIEQSWLAFLEKNEGREVAQIAQRSGRGTLGRVDPLAQIEAGR